MTYEVSLSKFSNLLSSYNRYQKSEEKGEKNHDNVLTIAKSWCLNIITAKQKTKQKNAMTHLIQTIFFSQDDKIKFQSLDKGNNNHNNDYTF